ncbi:MAG: DUF2089 family protein [Cytophagales bacterium]|nr:DUF2089 family protein [Cytophagales bacterium]
MIKKIPVNCPSCDHLLNVTGLQCPNCDTMVSGQYQLPLLASLSNEEQEFILNFFKESGKLNTMAKHLNVSYPTLRNRLDDLIEKVKRIEQNLNEQS